MSDRFGDGGKGIVGIEYSLGNEYDEADGDLCFAESDRTPKILGRCNSDSLNPSGEDETPRIFDNN